MSELKAFNCEICGGKTYCKEDEPFACANGCRRLVVKKTKAKKEQPQEPVDE